MFENVDDSFLQEIRDSAQKNIDMHQQEIDQLKKIIQGAEAEQNRRALEAFWQAHPGLRLEVGDQLQVTTELIAYKRDQHNWDERSLQMLKTSLKITIADLWPDDIKHMVCIWHSTSSSTSISLDIARGMREAYLASQGERG